MNPTITSALIAGAISLVAALITSITSRSQVRAKIDELLQSQFKDIIAKRIQVYPTLWRIVQEQLSDWERLRKPITGEWATTLRDHLIDWHIENGAFLSQATYEAFATLRSEAVDLARRCEHGYEPTLDDLQRMDRIYYQGYRQANGEDHLPLATCIKNDLGSYTIPALTVKR